MLVYPGRYSCPTDAPGRYYLICSSWIAPAGRPCGTPRFLLGNRPLCHGPIIAIISLRQFGLRACRRVVILIAPIRRICDWRIPGIRVRMRSLGPIDSVGGRNALERRSDRCGYPETNFARRSGSRSSMTIRSAQSGCRRECAGRHRIVWVWRGELYFLNAIDLPGGVVRRPVSAIRGGPIVTETEEYLCGVDLENTRVRQTGGNAKPSSQTYRRIH